MGSSDLPKPIGTRVIEGGTRTGKDNGRDLLADLADVLRFHTADRHAYGAEPERRQWCTRSTWRAHGVAENAVRTEHRNEFALRPLFSAIGHHHVRIRAARVEIQTPLLQS